MSNFILKDKHIEFHYGYDPSNGEYWYQVYDNTVSNNDGLVENQSSIITNMSNLLMAEKMKQFNAPTEHIKKILWMQKI